MPRGIGLSEAVQNFVNVQMMKRDRERQDIIDKLNEEMAQFKFEQSKKEAAQLDDYLMMLEREATPTYPTAPGAPQVARPYQFNPAEAARLQGLKGVYKYPQPEQTKYQQYEAGTEFGAFDPTTGQYIKRGDVAKKPGKGASVTFKTPEGLSISGEYEQVKPYMDKFGVQQQKQDTGDPRWEQAIDNAYRQLTGGESNVHMEILTVLQARPEKSYLEAFQEVMASKNVDYDEIMRLAARYYQAAQTPGQIPTQNQEIDIETIRKNLRAQGFREADIDEELKRRGLLNANP